MYSIVFFKDTYAGCCGHSEQDEDDEVQDQHSEQDEQHFVK